MGSGEWDLIPVKIQKPSYSALALVSSFGMKESCDSELELICNTNTRISSQQTMMLSFGHMQTIGGPIGWNDSWTWEKKVQLDAPMKSWVMSAQEPVM